jgi:hypothetical protein
MAMSDELFEYLDGFDTAPRGLHMLAGLSGFTDAGGTHSQIADNIFGNFQHELLVQFNNDELLDYRSRRPVFFFERDHIEHYEPAVLGIYLVNDEANQPFLYLHGYEPDFKWEAFAEAFAEIFEVLEVRDLTWVHAIPFPIPHSRPVGITVSGNRQDIIESVSEWKPQTQVPGNILHLIEYNLTRAGINTVGFVMLVPHYLSDSDFPQSAVAALEQVSAATGLVFETDSLRDEGKVFLEKLNEQIEKNEELAKVVNSLEQGYANSRSNMMLAPITKPRSKMPSAEEIAEELESYLANRRRNEANDQ